MVAARREFEDKYLLIIKTVAAVHTNTIAVQLSTENIAYK